MRFGVVLKWFGVVWCVLGGLGCFHGLDISAEEIRESGRSN